MSNPASLKLESVSGILRWRRQSINVKCRIRVDRYGVVRFALNPVKLVKTNAWLLKLSAPTTRFLPKMTFEGMALTGESIHSNSLFVDVKPTSTPTSANLLLKGKAYHLRVDYAPRPKTSRHCAVIYRTVGMLGYGTPSIVTNLGKLTLTGPHEIKHYDWLHGRVTVEEPNNSRALRKWIGGCDQMADRVLEVVSFAEGRLIRWSVRSLYKDNNPIAHEFFGPQRTTDPHDPVFYFLHLQPILDLAVTRYTCFVRRNLGFGVALEWFLQRPSYIELQLLTSMTAIEHLVSIFKHNRGGAKNIGKHVFQAVVAPSRTALKAVTPANPEEKAAIDLVLSNLMRANEAPLQTNIESMLKFYQVPVAGLETRLGAAIKARNNVVHRGLHSSRPRRKIYSHVEVLREVFVRTFLSVLKYNGRYRTWLDAIDEMAFPPKS